jgi:cytochrome c553
MKTNEEIAARLGTSVVALASLCLVLAAIIVLMLNRRYTTDLEIAVNDMQTPSASPPVNKSAGPSISYTPGPNGIDGQKLFRQNCASCHDIGSKKLVGPGLAGVTGRVPSEKWLHEWIRNNQKLINEGEPYAVKIKKENGAAMTIFEFLSDEDIQAIIDYISLSY